MALQLRSVSLPLSGSGWCSVPAWGVCCELCLLLLVLAGQVSCGCWFLRCELGTEQGHKRGAPGDAEALGVGWCLSALTALALSSRPGKRSRPWHR